MDRQLRWVAFAVVAVFVLGGLALFAPRALPGAAMAERRQAEEKLLAKTIDCTPNPHFEKYRGFGPDWQFLRASNDGARVEFNPFTIACNPQNGRRDVWVQISHRRNLDATIEDETTIQKITYNRERARYRIDCVNRQSALIERQLMGDAPEDIAHSERVGADDIVLAPIQAGGIVDALIGPACSTGRL